MQVEPGLPVQKLLIFGCDQPAALEPALTALQQEWPDVDLTLLDSAKAAWLFCAQGHQPADWARAVTWISHCQYDAALILTAPGQSPFTLAYLCYLAGIPIRIGQSWEFGGQVLTHCLPPPESPDCNRHLHLLQGMGLVRSQGGPERGSGRIDVQSSQAAVARISTRSAPSLPRPSALL